MRTYTTTHTVYDFKELDEKAKQKAIEFFREGEDFPMLSEEMQYWLESLLKKYKITYNKLPKVYYSLGYCQGDGAMFEGEIFWKSYTISVKQSGMYYHYNSKEFIDFRSTKTDKEANDKAYDDFNRLYVYISKRLAEYGYKIIEETISDESITDMIISNGYEFTKEGKLA